MIFKGPPKFGRKKKKCFRRKTSVLTNVLFAVALNRGITESEILSVNFARYQFLENLCGNLFVRFFSRTVIPTSRYSDSLHRLRCSEGRTKGQQAKDPCAREHKDAGPYRVLRRVKESSCTTDAGTYSVLRRVKESS